MMLTKAKLNALKKAYKQNMTDAEVVPLLEHIVSVECQRDDALEQVSDLSMELAEARAENERLRVEMEQHMQVAASRCSRLLDTEAALEAAREENERLKRSMDNRREMRWVDMTPDAGLVARILSAYIDNTSCTDNLAGLDPESFICKMMNEHTAQRNVLLNSALAALRSQGTDQGVRPTPDDAGRVERVADEMFLLSRLVDNRSFDEDRDYWMGVARSVLAAADREGE